MSRWIGVGLLILGLGVDQALKQPWRYIGTAGHTAVEVGQLSTWKGNKGPPAVDGSARTFGRFVFAVLDPAERLDFALIRLDKGLEYSAAVCHFGGPTGINSKTTSDPETIAHYGNGVGWGSSIPARTSIAERGFYDRSFFYASGLGNFGDSGSPVMDAEGRAVGVLVAIGPVDNVASTDDLGEMAIFRISHQIALAEKQLKIDLTIERAPQAL